MITVDIFLAIAVFLSVFLCVVFIVWIFYNFYNEKTADHDIESVHQCPYCTYVFVNHSKQDVLVCPRCWSYITDNPLSG